MYKKAWCTCKVVVLRNKPIVFLTSWLPSRSSLLKLPKLKLLLLPKKDTVSFGLLQHAWSVTIMLSLLGLAYDHDCKSATYLKINCKLSTGRVFKSTLKSIFVWFRYLGLLILRSPEQVDSVSSIPKKPIVFALTEVFSSRKYIQFYGCYSSFDS